MKNDNPRLKIIGTTVSSLPAKIQTNADVELIVDTSDEWITTRTGIKERGISSDGGFTSTFAIEASRGALEMAGISAQELDLITLGTVTPDFPFPATSCIIQHELKATVAFDIFAACSSLIYGLSIADSYLRGGMAKKAPVIGAEVLLRVVDWSDKITCFLLGNGSGTALLELFADDTGIMST